MKKRLMIALTLALCCLAACAMGQTLPGIETFSPGLTRVAERTARGERVEMTASMTAEDIAYARDLSVLAEMLSGTQLRYTGWGGARNGADRLTLSKAGQTLLSLGLDRGEDGALLTVNGEDFAVDLSGLSGPMDAADGLAGVAVLERVPLMTVCEAIEGLRAGDALPGGFTVTQAFTVRRTMSDDGTRLTKIDITGSIARAGEAPWVIEGFLRQPGGRSPKDTFELTATRDEDNFLELSYSALRKSEITRKDRAGLMSVDTALKVAGRLGGSKVTSRLTVYLRNNWTADGENLAEKITVSATLGHTDNRPGLRMQRLNDISAKLRCVLSLDTAEAGQETIGISDNMTLNVVMDGNTFLDCAADMDFAVGGAGDVLHTNASPAPQEALEAALREAVVSLAGKLYAGLGDGAREKIEAGL